MSSKNTPEARARAEERFKKEQQVASAGAKARAEYDARQAAVEANTARLRALRLEKEEAERSEQTTSTKPRSKPKDGAR